MLEKLGEYARAAEAFERSVALYREALARRRGPRPRKPVRLKTVKGDGVHEGVDLDDNAALLDLMES